MRKLSIAETVMIEGSVIDLIRGIQTNYNNKMRESYGALSALFTLFNLEGKITDTDRVDLMEIVIDLSVYGKRSQYYNGGKIKW